MEKRTQSGSRQEPAPAAPVQGERRHAGHSTLPLPVEEARRQLGWGLIVASRRQAG